MNEILPLDKKIDSFTTVDKLKASGTYPYFRVLESDQDAEVTIGGKKILMFGSNSYLGLTNNPYVKDFSKMAVEMYGSGCAGSRFLNGTLDLHIELEHELADFVGKEAALVFSTGYQVNLGVISALGGRNDFLFLDEYDHACIIDGVRLSFAKTFKYSHSNMMHLEDLLKNVPREAFKLIITEGVFSMEGDISLLPEITQLAKKYNASVYVDDAHALGVIGPHGRGSAAHFNLTDNVDFIMGTFSKSLASIGGFIAADRKVIEYLKHHVRSLIFSASISPAGAASALAALTLLNEDWNGMIEKLWGNTEYSTEQFKNAGFDIGPTETPIIPIYIRDNEKTFSMAKILMEEGVFVNPIVSPAVPGNSSLIRFSLMAVHNKEQIDFAVDKFIKAANLLEIPLTKKQLHQLKVKV